MILSPYPRNKPSGVAWIGDVPSHWSVSALSYRYQVALGKMLDEKRITGVASGPYLRNVDVQWDSINVDNLPIMDFEGADIDRYALKAGDLLVCEGGDVGRAAIWRAPISTCFYQKALHRVRAYDEECDAARYLFYVLKCATSLDVFTCGQGKTTIAHLPAETFRRHRFPFPPLDEQICIICFLDQEVTKIDCLVAEQERLIALVDEKRRAVISHAVTKGLDPTISVKESGIEGLGCVPSNWIVARLKHVGTITGGAGFPHEEQGKLDQELPFYKVADLSLSADGCLLNNASHTISRNVASSLRARIIPPGSVVYAKIGAALLLNKRRITSNYCCIDNNMTAFVPYDDVMSERFAWYWLGLQDFGKVANPGAVPSLSEGDQAILPVLVPPLDEQLRIVAFLDASIEQSDALIQETVHAIKLLKERRAALISDTVTGKIDVRGFSEADRQMQAAAE